MTHLYVFSLGHSGSTILNIALASLPGALSIGEAEATIRRMDGKQHTCTCGVSAPACPVWGPLFSDPELIQNPDLTRGYRALYGAARTTGNVSLLVDSSKHLRALQRRPADTGVDARVIFLVKDPRGYFVSHYRKWQRTRDSGQVRFRLGLAFLTEIAVALAGWWYGNRKILRALRAGADPFIVLSYEDLVLDTDRTAARLGDFLGLPVTFDTFGRNPEQLHILRGNSLRHDPERSSRLVYDYRWFTDPWVHRLGFAFRPLLRWAMRRGLLSTGKR